MFIDYKKKKPKLGEDVFTAPTAVLVGDVKIADGASIWYGAVLRGDLNAINIGRNTNIQDNCTIHVDESHSVTVGEGVTIGHNTVLHGCTIEDGCVVGMGSVILNGALIKKGSIVAAGSVVRENQVVGPHQLVAGSPAEVKRELSPDSAEANLVHARTYAVLAEGHRPVVKEHWHPDS